MQNSDFYIAKVYSLQVTYLSTGTCPRIPVWELKESQSQNIGKLFVYLFAYECSQIRSQNGGVYEVWYARQFQLPACVWCLKTVKIIKKIYKQTSFNFRQWQFHTSQNKLLLSEGQTNAKL